MNIETYIAEKTTKEELYLNNTEAASHPDFGTTDYIKVSPGTKINVFVKEYPDGRTYFTAFFKDEKGVYYCNTKMKKNGKIYPNCGGILASKELKEILG